MSPPSPPQKKEKPAETLGLGGWRNALETKLGKHIQCPVSLSVSPPCCLLPLHQAYKVDATIPFVLVAKRNKSKRGGIGPSFDSSHSRGVFPESDCSLLLVSCRLCGLPAPAAAGKEDLYLGGCGSFGSTGGGRPPPGEGKHDQAPCPESNHFSAAPHPEANNFWSLQKKALTIAELFRDAFLGVDLISPWGAKQTLEPTCQAARQPQLQVLAALARIWRLHPWLLRPLPKKLQTQEFWF